jgi:hypothetical protein
MDNAALEEHVTHGIRLLEAGPLENSRSNACSQTALKIAVAVGIMSILGFHFR